MRRIRVATALLVLAMACGGPAGTGEEDRGSMVEIQHAGRGITHAGVLDAMRRVPRHRACAGPTRQGRARRSTRETIPVRFVPMIRRR